MTYILGMSPARSGPADPATMPSAADVQQDPTILARLPQALIAELRWQISHLAADVDTAWYQTPTEARTLDPRTALEPDRLLKPEAAAARFRVAWAR